MDQGKKPHSYDTSSDVCYYGTIALIVLLIMFAII